MTAIAAALLAESADEIRRVAREAAERTATAQGLPPRIADQTVLRQVAALIHQVDVWRTR
jgi:hypothetical protein